MASLLPPPPILYKIDIKNTVIDEMLQKLDEDSHDVCIQSNGRKFMVHRDVLTVASNFFANILKSPAHINSKKVIINLPSSITADSVENVIHFIYSGELKVTLESVNHLRFAASLFNLNNIISLCDKYEKFHNPKKPLDNNRSTTSPLEKKQILTERELSSEAKPTVQRESSVTADSGPNSVIDLTSDSCSTDEKLSDFKIIVKQAIMDKLASNVFADNNLIKENSTSEVKSELSCNNIEIITQDNAASSEEPSPIIVIDSVRSLDKCKDNLSEKSDDCSTSVSMVNDSSIDTVKIKKEPESQEEANNLSTKSHNSCYIKKKMVKSASVTKNRHNLKPKVAFLPNVNKKNKASSKGKHSHPVNINFNNGENITFEHQDPAAIINKLLQGNSNFNQYPINITFNNVVVNQIDSEAHEISKCQISPFCSGSVFSKHSHSRNSYLNELWTIVYDEHDHKLFQCNFCKKIFLSVNRCVEHIKAKHIQNRFSSFPCRFCYSNANFQTLHSYSVSKSGNKKYLNSLKNGASTLQKFFICKVCGERFNLQSLLLKHKYRKHDIVKDYNCKSCSYKCDTHWAMKIHLYSHANNKPHKCSQCSYHASTALELQVHLLKRHNNPEG